MFKLVLIFIALSVAYLFISAKKFEKESLWYDDNQKETKGKFWLPDSLLEIFCKLIASIFLIYAALQFYDPRFPVTAILIIPFVMITGMLWVGPVFEHLAGKFTMSLYGLGEKQESKPKYEQAESRWKSGRPAEAIQLIDDQLDEFPEDFEGQMLKAQIQIESLKDFDSAEATLLEITSQKKHNAGKITLALNQLADWHLKRGDEETAKKTLKDLCTRYPNSQIEFNCSQRLARLDFSIDSNDPRDASEIVSLCLKQLDQHPLDNHTRDQLARVYFTRYGKPDLAWEQMNKLFNNPFQQPRDITRWLNLMADWHLIKVNPDGARACLQQIMSRYPDMPYCEEAQDRLTRIKDL